MFGASKLEIFANWLIPFRISERLLVLLITILPILAYPFLPSASRLGFRCEMFLIWPFLLIAILTVTIRATEQGSKGHEFVMDLWQSTLILVSASAGIHGFRVPSGRKPEPRDFSRTAELLPVLIGVGLLFLFEDVFLLKPAEIDLVPRLLRLLTVAVGICSVSLMIFFCLNLKFTAFIFKFTTRHVSWWYWLPENGAADDFGPRWSIALAVFAGIAPLLLFLTIFNAREGNKPI